MERSHEGEIAEEEDVGLAVVVALVALVVLDFLD